MQYCPKFNFLIGYLNYYYSKLLNLWMYFILTLIVIKFKTKLHR